MDDLHSQHPPRGFVHRLDQHTRLPEMAGPRADLRRSGDRIRGASGRRPSPRQSRIGKPASQAQQVAPAGEGQGSRQPPPHVGDYKQPHGCLRLRRPPRVLAGRIRRGGRTRLGRPVAAGYLQQRAHSARDSRLDPPESDRAIPLVQRRAGGLVSAAMRRPTIVWLDNTKSRKVKSREVGSPHYGGQRQQR